MVWIKYIIPEDGDDHTHPNIYQFSENGEVLVSDIVKVKNIHSPESICFCSDMLIRVFQFLENIISAF